MEERSLSRINVRGELEQLQFETWVKVEGFNGYDPVIESMERIWKDKLSESKSIDALIYPVTDKN